MKTVKEPVGINGDGTDETGYDLRIWCGGFENAHARLQINAGTDVLRIRNPKELRKMAKNLEKIADYLQANQKKYKSIRGGR